MTDSFDWFRIAQAAFIIMMILFIWPNAKRMWKESPKGTQKDWLGYMALMAGVILFIFFLISSVRG